MAKTIVVLGARNLGGAIARHFLDLGWNAAAVARSEESLAPLRERGALAVAADAADLGALTGVLEQVRSEYGSLDAVVNAVSAARPPGSGPFGGGPLADADLAAFHGWTVAVAEQAFVFLSAGAQRRSGRAAAARSCRSPVAPSRRAFPGRGLWAAGAFATRALVQAAAQEYRDDGIHAALLAVDATIESPKTEAFTRDTPRNALADMQDVAEAVAFLVSQGERGYTHELAITPAGDRWIP